jgi:hypothetical protein
MQVPWALQAGAFAWLVGGCRAPTSEIASIISDSAGVSIITIQSLPSLDDPGFLWEVDTIREIPLDRGLFAAPILYRPQNMARFPDGTIVVNDQSGEFRIAVIDAVRDSVTARFAPSGSGPGEIRGFAYIWPGREATIWVMDFGNARLSRFRLDGRLELEQSMIGSARGTLGLKLRPEPPRLFVHQWFPSQAPDTRAFLDTLRFLDETTGTYHTVIPLPRQPGPQSSYKQLSPRVIFAPLPTGIVSGTTHGAEFLVHDDAGLLLRTIRLPFTLRESSEADIPAYLEDMRSLPELRSVAASSVELYPTYPLAYDLFDVRRTDDGPTSTGRGSANDARRRRHAFAHHRWQISRRDRSATGFLSTLDGRQSRTWHHERLHGKPDHLGTPLPRTDDKEVT